jgi:uncharacterized protein involved in tolerance to divalent cations
MPDRYLMAMATTDAREEAERLARELVDRRLAAHIEASHGYETPELTAVPIGDGSPGYLAWVSSATASP